MNKKKYEGYHCKLPVGLKDELKKRAALERKPVVSLVQEFCIMGLHVKSIEDLKQEEVKEKLKGKINPIEDIGFINCDENYA